MSFNTYAYTAEDGQVYKLKLKPETASAGSFTATSGFTTGVYAKVSKGKSEHGLKPRGVNLSREATATVSRFLPVVSNAVVEQLVSTGTVTVDGETWTVTSASPEDY